MNYRETSPAKNPTKNRRIVCIGMPVRDLVFRVGDLPARGHKVQSSHFSEISGGNALNAAIAITRLGGRALMTGPMGDVQEKASDYIFDDLAREKIESSGLVRMPGLVTPISNIMIDSTAERTIVTFRDPALWKVKLPDADVLLADCDAILVESRCASFATELCVEARRRNIPVVLDGDNPMSMREGLLVASSHIIFSSEALHGTADVTDDNEALRKIAGLTPAFVAVTNGAHGMRWLDEKRKSFHLPAFPVHPVDTLGAGDVFHGAFALGVAEGQSLHQAMRFASAAAALKCTRYGGAFAAPDRAEVDAMLKDAPALQQAGE